VGVTRTIAFDERRTRESALRADRFDKGKNDVNGAAMSSDPKRHHTNPLML